MHPDRRRPVFTPKQMRDQLESSAAGRWPPSPPIAQQSDKRSDPSERAKVILVWIVGAEAFALFFLVLALITR